MNEILSILVGREVDESVIEQGFIGNSQQSAGCFIKTNYVFGICNGVIIGIDRDPNNSTWSITVEVDSQHWIRYCNISATPLLVGASAQVYDRVGYSTDGLMRLEYCNSDKSKFPVRVGSRQLYKQDPTPIIFSNNILAGEF